MLRSWIISVAQQLPPDNAWGSDFSSWPIGYGADVVVDPDIDDFPMGRNPDTGLPRWVVDGILMDKSIVTEGVYSWSDKLAITYPVTPNVAVAEIKSVQSVLVDIHGTGGYLVLASNDYDTGESLNYSGMEWGKDEPIPAGRWTPLRNGLVTMGVPAATVDNWRTANPDGTPTQFFFALQNYMRQQ